MTVTDALGCSDSLTIVIDEPAVLALSETHVDVSCNAGNDGSIDLTVADGTAPYGFSWSNAASSEDISVLTAGTYKVTVTDANGCQDSLTVVITEPDVLALSNTSIDVSCNAESDGSIDMTIAGWNRSILDRLG